MSSPATPIIATYDGKAFMPDELVAGLVPGQRVWLTVETPADLPPSPPLEGQREGETFDEFIDRIAVDDPSLPTDLSYQHDHYLYGTPKR